MSYHFRINSIIETIVSLFDNPSGDIKESYAPLLAYIIEANHKIDDFVYDPEDDERQTIIDTIEEIEFNWSDDFTLDFDGNEYRIISDSAIWEIYKEEIQQTIEDCYDLKLDKLPDFLAWSIDWEQTAKNCYVDGYGHHFSSYDGSEIESRNHYIFRTN